MHRNRPYSFREAFDWLTMIENLLHSFFSTVFVYLSLIAADFIVLLIQFNDDWWPLFPALFGGSLNYEYFDSLSAVIYFVFLFFAIHTYNCLFNSSYEFNDDLNDIIDD